MVCVCVFTQHLHAIFFLFLFIFRLFPSRGRRTCHMSHIGLRIIRYSDSVVIIVDTCPFTPTDVVTTTTTWTTENKCTRHDIFICEWMHPFEWYIDISLRDSLLWLDRWRVECSYIVVYCKSIKSLYTLYITSGMKYEMIIPIDLRRLFGVRTAVGSLSTQQRKEKELSIEGDLWSPGNRPQSEHKWWWPGIQFSQEREREVPCIGSFVVQAGHPALPSAPAIWRRRSQSIFDGDDKTLERYIYILDRENEREREKNQANYIGRARIPEVQY
jgi:hypothetical protein